MKYGNNILLRIFIFSFVWVGIMSGCKKSSSSDISDSKHPAKDTIVSDPYPGVQKSDIYSILIVKNGESERPAVFQNNCPVYSEGFMNMQENDRFPLEIFEGRSISWTKFILTGTINVEVKVLSKDKVPINGSSVKVLPSRHNIVATLTGETIRFTLSQPGQYSLEIGENGYKNGLIIFADPVETDIPDRTTGNYAVLKNASSAIINGVSSSYSGIILANGVHNIGVYKVPAYIKNIYFEEGAWVYGAIVMEGVSNVKIFGRGVLSSAKLKYRESHCIEAINQSNNIRIDGIVLADPKYYGVRLIGQNNSVSWTKVIGGWVYNCDGITAYAGSTVSNCFIWANDDAIKIYRNNINWSDCVVWQLNNGGIIQMAWGGSNADQVKIQRIDVLRAEWNKPGFNRALLNCVGNRYQEPGKTGQQTNWLIEDITTEHPLPVIFNIAPDTFSTNHIHGLTLKNWNVKMKIGTSFRNIIAGNDSNEYFDGFVFDNVVFNGTKLTESNWLQSADLVVSNLITPQFR